MQAQPALPPSWEGMQAGQALILRQAALITPSWEGVQALIPRQEALTLSQKGVQAVIPRQAGWSADSAGTYFQAGSANPQPRRSAGTYSKADSVNPPISQEGMQAVQALFPNQAQSPSPSQGASGATVGDVTSSPDNRAGITREQGLRPRSSRGSPPAEGNTLEDPSHKWAINLSSKPLTEAQRSLLGKGPNYAKAPRHPPNLEYITAIESVCTKVSQQDVEEFRADINRVLRDCHPKSNFSNAEAQAIRELKGDKDRLVLTADKGVAMIVLDRQDYIYISNNLLAQQAYMPIPRDYTNKIKAKLITMFRKVKNQTGLDNNTYKAMYPTGCSVPKFYGLPKIHKLDTPSDL